MNFLNYFKPVPTLSAEKVREILKGRDAGDYNLIDVRQPGEYEEEHLPGSRLIPLGELNSRLKELDPHKQTIAY